MDTSVLVSHSECLDLMLVVFLSFFQDSGISGRKRKASISLTDDEGLFPLSAIFIVYRAADEITQSCGDLGFSLVIFSWLESSTFVFIQMSLSV